MQKLRLAAILPLAQVIIALGLFKWGHYEQRRVGYALYVSTGRHLCFAINAPARLLCFVFDDLFPDTFVPNIFGYYFDEILILPGVGLVWFLVGRGLDRLRGVPPRSQSRMTIPKAVFNLFLLAYGVYLFWGETVMWFWYRNQLLSAGTHLYDAPFYWAWSIVLILVPVVSFAKVIPHKLASSTPDTKQAGK